MNESRRVVRERNFMLLLVSDVVSVTGGAMASVAVPFAVIDNGGTATEVGLVVLAGMLPNVLLLLFGGVVADRLPRQHVMLAANLSQALARGAFGLLELLGSGSLWPMAALNAAGGAAAAFYAPASQGLVTATVPQPLLAQANAFRRLGINAGQIAGLAFGGLLVAAVGPGWVLLADAASFLLAAGCRAWMRLPPIPMTAADRLMADLVAGWRVFKSRRWLWVIGAQSSLVNAIYAGAITVLGPVVADRRLGGATSWGFILSAQAVGAVVGAAVMVRYTPRRLLLVANLAAPTIGLPLLALSGDVPLFLVVAASFVAGIGIEGFEINWLTVIQQEIPPAFLSRIFAYDAVGSYALSPLGTALAGPSGAAIGIPGVLSLGGALIVISSLAVLILPEIRNLSRSG